MNELILDFQNQFAASSELKQALMLTSIVILSVTVLDVLISAFRQAMRRGPLHKVPHKISNRPIQ